MDAVCTQKKNSVPFLPSCCNSQWNSDRKNKQCTAHVLQRLQ